MGIITKNCKITPLDGVSREDWLEIRKSSLGGSDAGVILGLSKYASPYSLWAEKLGLAEREEAGLAAEMGNLLEDTVAFLFARESNLRVVKWNVMLHAKNRPWASANIDFWVSTYDAFPEGVVTEWKGKDEPPELTELVECKTSAIVTHGTNHLWADGDVPMRYQAQGAWYAGITGLRVVNFAALLGGEGLETRRLEWDEETLQVIQDAGDNFWHNHIETQVPPPVDEKEATEEALKSRFPSHVPGKEVEGNDQTLAMWDTYSAAAEQEKYYKEQKQAARNQLMNLIGDAEAVTFEGSKIFTFRQQKGKRSINADRLREEFPEAYDACYEEGKPYRTLRKSNGK